MHDLCRVNTLQRDTEAQEIVGLTELVILQPQCPFKARMCS